MKRLTVLFFMLISISLSAQNSSKIPDDSTINLSGAIKATTEIQNLFDLDMKVMNSLPLISDYKNLSVTLKKLPNEYFRYVDSIDYYMVAKDTLFVRIYSQDYAYQNRNGFKIGLDLKDPKSAMKIYNISLDMKMKDVIIDYLIFMNRKFEYSIFTKAIKGKEKIIRTIIRKKFTTDGSNAEEA